MDQHLLNRRDALAAENATEESTEESTESDDEGLEELPELLTADVRAIPEATDFEVEDDIKLASAALLDILSDAPRQVQPQANLTQEPASENEATINWDF
jgi:hypothetical protein